MTYQKGKILMAYISIFGEHFLKLPKKEILIDYISRSYDPQKAKNGDYLYKQVMWLSKKGKFDGLYKHFWGAFSEKLPKKEIWWLM